MNLQPVKANLCQRMRSVRDFGLYSSEMLYSAASQFVTDVSGQLKCPTLKVEIYAETSITDHQPKLCNTPEKGAYSYCSTIILFNDTELVT
jgi:hypothetical protein